MEAEKEKSNTLKFWRDVIFKSELYIQKTSLTSTLFGSSWTGNKARKQTWNPRNTETNPVE